MEPFVVWLDMQLPLSMKRVFGAQPGLSCVHIREFGMQRAVDPGIFDAARQVGVQALVTKDSDFIELVRRHGVPPSIVWLRCGNETSSVMNALLAHHLDRIVAMVRSGEPIIEID